MTTLPQSGKRGFMQIVLLAIAVFFLLAYFNIDLRTLLENPIFEKLGNIFVVAWVAYIKPLFIYLWTSIAGISK